MAVLVHGLWLSESIDRLLARVPRPAEGVRLAGLDGGPGDDTCYAGGGKDTIKNCETIRS